MSHTCCCSKYWWRCSSSAHRKTEQQTAVQKQCVRKMGATRQDSTRLTDDTGGHEAEPLAGDTEDGAALQRGDQAVHVDHVAGPTYLRLGTHHLHAVEPVPGDSEDKEEHRQYAVLLTLTTAEDSDRRRYSSNRFKDIRSSRTAGAAVPFAAGVGALGLKPRPVPAGALLLPLAAWYSRSSWA